MKSNTQHLIPGKLPPLISSCLGIGYSCRLRKTKKCNFLFYVLSKIREIRTPFWSIKLLILSRANDKHKKVLLPTFKVPIFKVLILKVIYA